MSESTPADQHPDRPPELAAIASAFAMLGDFQSARPHGNGHINDTYAVVRQHRGRPLRYILQRINAHVFRDIPALMNNIVRVTSHIAAQLENQPTTANTMVPLHVIPTHGGENLHCDPAGGFWRCYNFIERASTHDNLQHPAQAREAARAFARFQQMLANLPGARLHETIPYFHHTVRRFADLRAAVAADRQGRAAGASEEIRFAFSREALAGVLLDLHARGDIPERITHNDTKLNNVMLDDVTGHGSCVIDLDTVMPGLTLYDFGDLVRSATNTAAEDETDLSRISLSLPVFSALLQGYREGSDHLLNAAETAHLCVAARLITFEVGIRFLTDHLNGDTYFKIRRPGHNLSRCRCQFALLRSMEDQESAMEQLVEQYVS